MEDYTSFREVMKREPNEYEKLAIQFLRVHGFIHPWVTPDPMRKLMVDSKHVPGRGYMDTYKWI